MNRIEEYLREYKIASESDIDQNWETFLEKYKDLNLKTEEYFNNNFNFFPNRTVSFHDSSIVGTIRPNLNEDSFNITMCMITYEKIENNGVGDTYRESNPVYVEFTVNNKFRVEYDKLAVKSIVIATLVYEEKNLGIIYLNQKGKVKQLYVENIDLAKSQVIEKESSKKLGM